MAEHLHGYPRCETPAGTSCTSSDLNFEECKMYGALRGCEASVVDGIPTGQYRCTHDEAPAAKPARKAAPKPKAKARPKKKAAAKAKARPKKAARKSAKKARPAPRKKGAARRGGARKGARKKK